MRLPDRVFANVVKFEDKYVKYDIDDVYKGDKDAKKEATGVRRSLLSGPIAPFSVSKPKHVSI